MKQIIRIGVALLMVFLIPNMSGCNNHVQNDSGNAKSSKVLSSSTALKETSNDNNDIPDVATEILRGNQRSHIEKEKTLRGDTSIAATVNGTPIYQAEIEIKMSANSTNRENFRLQLESMNLSGQEKTKAWEDYTSVPLPDKKTILSELIREMVIQLQVLKQNLSPTEEETLTSAQEQFTIIKETPRIYASAQIYMEIMNLSEESYLRQIVDEQKKELGRKNLYREVTKNFDDETEKDKVFKTAVDKWIAQSDIKTINDQE